MAKIGPKAPAYDPFRRDPAGSGAFDALEEALDDVEAGRAPAVQGGSTEAPMASAPEAAPKPRRTSTAAPAKTPGQKREPKGSAPQAQAKEAPEADEQPIETPRLTLTKRVKTTRDEARQFEAAATRLAASLEISVDFSKITRALWEVYLRHEQDILRNVAVEEGWSRPSNQDAVKLAALDTQLADLINDGFMVACRRPSSSSGRKR